MLVILVKCHILGELNILGRKASIIQVLYKECRGLQRTPSGSFPRRVRLLIYGKNVQPSLLKSSINVESVCDLLYLNEEMQ
jgi:hypothetical protein